LLQHASLVHSSLIYPVCTWPGPQIVERDVPARYLLRLGMGEAELETELDFSRVGRVNAMLARRLELLAEVSGWGDNGAPAQRRGSCSCVPQIAGGIMQAAVPAQPSHRPSDWSALLPTTVHCPFASG
jgi:hypothetical protein